MQININGRGAFLGAFAAIALAALTAAQLPSLQARSAGGGYMGLMNPGRELWRFSVEDQINTGAGYTVPAGKELVICGLGTQPSWNAANGQASLQEQSAYLFADDEPLWCAYLLTPQPATCFPGLSVAEGSTLEFRGDNYLLDSIYRRHAFAYGYLRDL
jgi:hypothetical protein